MDEPNQAPKPVGITPKKHILALSWHIATQPKLYWELAPNPYSTQALQIISERFPYARTDDVIRAVILAEPEGSYDRNLKLLGTTQQAEELRKQRNTSARIHERLVKYGKECEEEFRRLPKELVYNSLSLIVFETADQTKAQQKYAQNQRIDFRLSIVNFIEDTQKDDDSSSTISASNNQPTLVRPVSQVVFAILSLVLLFYLAQKPLHNTSQHAQAQNQVLGVDTQQKKEGLPVRLKIPSIDVYASIENVGVTSEGAMEIPSNSVDVGWFNLGPRPGEEGNAVIAGHVDGESGATGVFVNLHKLKKGDKLYVEDSLGTVKTFVVSESRVYDPGYAEEVFSAKDGVHLNLVTCDGVWDGTKKSYTKRLIVFADIL